MTRDLYWFRLEYPTSSQEVISGIARAQMRIWKVTAHESEKANVSTREPRDRVRESPEHVSLCYGHLLL